MKEQWKGHSELPMVLFIVLALILPVQAVTVGQGNDAGEKTAVVASDGLQEGMRVLSDGEVKELGLSMSEIPTRSEPWNSWQRFHYHSGGEQGLAVYHQKGNRVFLYGGGSSSWSQQGGYWSHSAYDDFFYFDLATKKWISLERTLSPGSRFRFSYAVDEARELFYVYGGFKEGSMANDLWMFNMSSLQWTRLVSSNALGTYERRSDAPMVIDTTDGPKGKLYIHMGMKDDNTNLYPDNLTGFYKLDLNSPGSTPVALNDGTLSGMTPRYQHDMCIDEQSKLIYLFGGRNWRGNYSREFWVYSITTDTWAMLSVEPSMTDMFGAKIFFRTKDKSVYLWGGRTSSTSEYEENRLFAYNTEIGAWSLVATSNTPLGRLLYHSHYSDEADRFAAFAGRYYYRGYYGITSARYRDLNYLDLPTMTWTAFPLNNSYETTTNGIFAYDGASKRIYYVGPNTAQNGTAFYQYWDIRDKNWYGRIYNPGTQPHSRSSAGMCFDEKNSTVYFYGGGYTTGWGMNTRYYDLADLWKLNVRTNTWTKVWDPAGPGKLQGMDLVFNPNDGNIYFFGGRYHPTEASETEAKGDFYKYNPSLNSFTKIPLSGSYPEKRYGAGMIAVPEMNKLFLLGGEDPNATNQKQYRDLWSYDLKTNIWTKLTGLSSTLTFGKLDYDPLTKELYLTGGDDYVIKKYRILEDKWTEFDPSPNPGSMTGNAHLFVPETRDLWVYGGGAKSGLWKIGIPPRLAIQQARFITPENGVDLAYAMYKPYEFGCTVKTVNGPQDLSRVTIDISHKKGSFVLGYNYTEDLLGNPAWTEQDNGDYAELVGSPTTSWDGLMLNINFQLLFHWNFTSKSNQVDRTIFIRANGIGVSKDELLVQKFLTVRNMVEMVGALKVLSEHQGLLSDKDWVQAGEMLEFSGPVVRYIGSTDIYPPKDTYKVSLWQGGEASWAFDTTPGSPLKMTVSAPDGSKVDLKYTVNISGTNAESELQQILFNISVDSSPPSIPSLVVLHADSPTDTRTNFDNDRIVFLNWQGSREDLSGLKTYFWSFEKNEGTRNGNETLMETEVELTLPKNGTNTVYVWAEDNVGNIGLAGEATITVDDEPIVFRVVSPDLTQKIPYLTLDVTVNLTDSGGSKIISQSVQYRYTNDGQNNVEQWTGSSAWKYYPEIWTNFQRNSYQFTLSLGKNPLPKLADSEENFIQFKATDGAGTEYLSPIYNIKVDTSLRFPKVTLLSPGNGTVFTNVEDVSLNWTTDFFLPGDVTYRLYISSTKKDVVDHLATVRVDLDSKKSSYNPDWLTHGVYYWTVIPVARNEIGNCTNGIFWFELNNVENYNIEATTDIIGIQKQPRGRIGFVIEFNIENLGQEIAVIRKSATLPPGFEISKWQGDFDNQGNLRVNIFETKSIYAFININDTAPLGVQNLTFDFVTTKNVKAQVVVQIQVTEKQAPPPPPKNESNLALYVGIAIAVVLILLVVIGIVYSVFFRKKTRKQLTEEQLDKNIEQDLIIGKDRTIAMAPTPKGLRPSPVKKGKAGMKHPEEDEELETLEEVEELEEDVQLVEEGSEDDWMNVVAAETVSLEREKGIVEDKAVKSDEQPKSLKDILNEMEGNIEDQ